MRKKSGRLAAEAFMEAAKEIVAFLKSIKKSNLTTNQVKWAFDYAIIRLYREFEDLILRCLITAINSDTEQLQKTTEIPFPKHLNAEVCEYLIIGDGYFDFHGREGLIKTLKKFLPNDHYLVTIIKKKTYLRALTILTALRNFSAHNSSVSKKRALQAINGKRLSSSGDWLKNQDRFTDITSRLTQLAKEIYAEASY